MKKKNKQHKQSKQNGNIVKRRNLENMLKMKKNKKKT